MKELATSITWVLVFGTIFYSSMTGILSEYIKFNSTYSELGVSMISCIMFVIYCFIVLGDLETLIKKIIK